MVPLTPPLSLCLPLGTVCVFSSLSDFRGTAGNGRQDKVTRRVGKVIKDRQVCKVVCVMYACLFVCVLFVLASAALASWPMTMAFVAGFEL